MNEHKLRISARNTGGSVHYYYQGQYIGLSIIFNHGEFYQSASLKMFIDKHNLKAPVKPLQRS